MFLQFNTLAVKRLAKLTLASLAAVLLAACVEAPQHPLVLNQQALENQQNRVGVMISKLPEPDVYLPHTGYLLRRAAIEAMNLSLSSHVATLKSDELSVVEGDLVQRLKAKGVNVVPIEKPFDPANFPAYPTDAPDTSKLDFSALKKEYNISHLLIVDVQSLGMWRSYTFYFPTSAPNAYLKANSYLVDLDNNRYQWFLPLELKKSAAGDWDEPPDFPGLTNAYYQVLTEAREAIVSKF